MKWLVFALLAIVSGGLGYLMPLSDEDDAVDPWLVPVAVSISADEEGTTLRFLETGKDVFFVDMYVEPGAQLAFVSMKSPAYHCVHARVEVGEEGPCPDCGLPAVLVVRE